MKKYIFLFCGGLRGVKISACGVGCLTSYQACWVWGGGSRTAYSAVRGDGKKTATCLQERPLLERLAAKLSKETHARDC